MNLVRTSVFATALLLMSGLLSSVSAFELSPSNMVLTSGGSNTVSILATDSSTNGVSVKITTQGMKITGFEPGEGVLYIGICDNGSAFNETSVCVDIAATENFVVGQILGTFTVEKTATGEATITIDSDSKYANGVTVTSQTFKVVDSTDQLPTQPGTDRTALALNNVLPLLIIAGIILIVIILLLVYILRGKKKDAKTSVNQVSGTQNSSMSSTNMASTDKPVLPPLTQG